MLPTVEQCDPARESFPRGRVATRHPRTSPSPALVIGSRTGADLVVELPTVVTRPTSFLSRRTRREVGAAGGSYGGRGSP